VGGKWLQYEGEWEVDVHWGSEVAGEGTDNKGKKKRGYLALKGQDARLSELADKHPLQRVRGQEPKRQKKSQSRLQGAKHSKTLRRESLGRHKFPREQEEEGLKKTIACVFFFN